MMLKSNLSHTLPFKFMHFENLSKENPAYPQIVGTDTWSFRAGQGFLTLDAWWPTKKKASWPINGPTGSETRV
jgi:hypothetical protein